MIKLYYFLSFCLFISSLFALNSQFSGELAILEADHFTNGNSSLHFILKTLDNEKLHLFPINKTIESELLKIGFGKKVQISGKYFEQSSFSLEEQKNLKIRNSFSKETYFNENFHSNFKIWLEHEKKVWGKQDSYLTVETFEPLLGLNFPLDGKLNTNKKASTVSISLRRMVVLIVDFNDEAVSCSLNSIDDEMWKNRFSLKGIFEQNSFGLTEFAGDIEGNSQWDIYGPVHINYNAKGDSNSCLPDDWANAVDEIVTSQGIKLENYQHRVYVLPHAISSTCGWEGLGNVGCGVACRAWIVSCERVEVYAHELGHNLGLRHASSDIDEKGYIVSYGDPTALMGNHFFSAKDQLVFNSPHKHQMEWVPQSKVLQVQTSGLYSISPINIVSEDALFPQVLYVKHPDWPSSTYQYFYFSYMTVLSNYSNRCIVHGVRDFYDATYFITALIKNGRIFQDKLYRISVTQWSVSSTEMQLSISFGCVMQETLIDFYLFQPNLASPLSDLNLEPTVIWTNKTIVELEAGKSTIVNLRVANGDSPLCTPVTYSLSADYPPGWDVGLQSTVFLNPGTTCYVEMTVNTPSTATSGDYVIRVNVTGITGDQQISPLHSSFIDAIIRINPSCQFNPPHFRLINRNDLHFAAGSKPRFLLVLENQDSIFCSPSNFKFALKFDDPQINWQFNFDSIEIPLYPGQIAYNELTLIVPDQISIENTTLTIITSSLETSQHLVQIEASIIYEGTCQNAPIITLLSPSLELQTRESIGSLMNIYNPNSAHCNPSLYLLYSSDKQVSTVPPMLLLPPKETKTSVIMYTAGMHSTSETTLINSSISVFNAFDPSQSSETILGVKIDTTICQRNSPDFSIYTPPTSDNSTLDRQQAYIYILNRDTWPCPTTTWKLEVVSPQHWEWKFGLGSTNIPLFPGNSTWFTLNGTFTEGMSILNFTLVIRDITSSDPTVIDLHAKQATNLIQIGPCLHLPPKVDWGPYPTFVKLNITDTFRQTLMITNLDNSFCEYRTIWNGVQAGSTQFQGKIIESDFNAYFDTIQLYSSNTGQMNFYLTPNPAKYRNYINTMLNVTLHIFSYFNFTELTIAVNVSFLCEKNPPMIKISPPVAVLPPGKISILHFNVSVLNRDTLYCSPSTFGLSTNLPQPEGGWSSVLNPPFVTLAPNKTSFQTWTLVTRENLPPGKPMSVRLNTYDGYQVFHNSRAELPFQIQCPKPRPVSNIVATSITPIYSFGLQAGPVFLTYEGCNSELWCCCPCKYRIERDGELLGFSDTLNYTDGTHLKVGVQYVYFITTIDRNGVESEPAVCGNALTVKIDPPSLKELIEYMGYSILSLLVLTIIVYIFYHVISTKMARSRGEDASYIPPPILAIGKFFKFLYERFKNKSYTSLELTTVTEDDYDEEEETKHKKKERKQEKKKEEIQELEELEEPEKKEETEEANLL